jgi:hypothetical protein
MPLSQPKFAAELKAQGYAKWKRCGLIRYRDQRSPKRTREPTPSTA